VTPVLLTNPRSKRASEKYMLHKTRPFGRRISFLSLAIAAVLATGCTTIGSASIPEQDNEPMVKGPAISEIVSPFDRALSCLDGRVDRKNLRFSVGSIVDATGKEQLSDGGAGKFVTQGAGDIVQSALFRAGVVVVNRRDPRVAEAEARWGIRDLKAQVPSTFFITGSINSLDFLPGGVFEAQVAGVGPRFRRHRMLVGLDLSLTETRTGRILSNIPLQKQIVATEEGFGVGRFFGDTLVSLDFGQNRREAVNYALRQMLNLATFELLTQLMKPENFIECYEMIESVDGVLGESRAAKKVAEYRSRLASGAAVARPVTPGSAASRNGVSSLEQSLNVEEAEGAKPVDLAGASPVVNGANGSLSPDVQMANSAESDAKTLRTLEIHRSAPAEESAEASKPISTPRAVVSESSRGALPIGWPSSCVTHVGAALPKVTPIMASTGGNELVLQSAGVASACLTDSTGKSWFAQFVPGSLHRFVGQAPWRIQSAELKTLNIQYQGQALKVPTYVNDRMELLERR